MCGRHDPQVTMLAFIDLETRVPDDHPLRLIKAVTDKALVALSPDLDRMCAEVGRPSIPPERLLKSSLLISLYSVRSERAFCEQLDYNLLFRWFLGMNLVEPSFDATTFTKNRGAAPEASGGPGFVRRSGAGCGPAGPAVGRTLHRGRNIDGTLIEAAASLKSFKPRDGDPPKTTDDDPGQSLGGLPWRTT